MSVKMQNKNFTLFFFFLTVIITQQLCTIVNTWSETHVIKPTSWISLHVSTLLHNMCTTFVHESFLFLFFPYKKQAAKN